MKINIKVILFSIIFLLLFSNMATLSYVILSKDSSKKTFHISSKEFEALNKFASVVKEIKAYNDVNVEALINKATEYILKDVNGNNTIITTEKMNIEDINYSYRNTFLLKSKSSHWVSNKNIGNILYIKIPNFLEETDYYIKKVLKESNYKGIIVDVRNNSGGYLNTAIKVSDIFLSLSPIVTVSTQKNFTEKTYNANSIDLTNKKPLIILVNENTASSAEVFVGSLKDNNRALIIGENTYGKSSIQSFIPIGNNNEYLKITTGHYELPSGKNIENVGVSPHIEIINNEKYDNQLEYSLEVMKEYVQ